MTGTSVGLWKRSFVGAAWTGEGQGQLWSAKQGLLLPSGFAETVGHSHVTR
jgi:hypothetical protein